MNRAPRSLSLLLTTLIATAALLSQALAGPHDHNESIDWATAGPSEIHSEMGRLKAERLLEQRLFQDKAAARVASTQTNYDVTFYDISLHIDDFAEILYGEVGIHAEAAIDGVGQVQVDLAAGLAVDSIVGPGGSLAFSRSGDVITVTLPATLNTGDPFSFVIGYHGSPTTGGFQGFTFDSRLGRKVISTLSEPYFARTWWPCKDRMDDKADSFDIAVTVDTLFYVGSNGVLDSTVWNGDHTATTYYRVRYPMATYLFSLAISEYHVWEDEWVYNNGQDTMPIVNAVYPDRDAYSRPRWGITPDALTALSNAYGLYPFVNEKYGHANFEWGGGMEHQTMTSMTGNSFGFNQNVVVHELGHQWWGDMITCKEWGHIWLNEGWAVYSEALYWEWLGGWNSYHAYMDSIKYTLDGRLYRQDTTDVWGVFDRIVYDKGGWVVHMLRHVLGDSLFFAGVDAYYSSQYKFGAATTEEMRDVFETATGVELDWFFDQWIYGRKFPSYQHTRLQEPSDSGGYELFIRIKQNHGWDPLVFTMPVDLAVDYQSGGTDTIKVWVDDRDEPIHLHVPDQVQNVKIDANSWILKAVSSTSWTMYLVTEQDEISTATQFFAYEDTIDYRGGTGSLTYSVPVGSLPPGLQIDNDGIITGTPTDSGAYSFTVKIKDNFFAYIDSISYTIDVAGTAIAPGDIAYDGTINISDLTYLVNYSFNGGQAPLSLNSADVNATCAVDIGDITYLVAYMFGGGAAPVSGCVSP